MDEYEGEERRAEMKKAMKEAIREWLDDQFATFGKWSLYGILAMILVVMTYMALKFAGWAPPIR
jgi:hypothetical protein